MSDLENIFNKRLNQLGIKKQVDAAVIVAEAQKVLDEIFNNESIRVISYNKGVLKICVKSNAWATECQARITKIKKPPVERVIFVVKNFEY
jgi:hypothetical protein